MVNIDVLFTISFRRAAESIDLVEIRFVIKRLHVRSSL